HHPFDQRRIFVQNVRLVEQDVRFEIGLVRLHCRVAVEAVVGDDAYDGGVADDGAAQVSDAHRQWSFLPGGDSLWRRHGPADGRQPQVVLPTAWATAARRGMATSRPEREDSSAASSTSTMCRPQAGVTLSCSVPLIAPTRFCSSAANGSSRWTSIGL